MSKTSIAWTDETWNPATGCRRVSRGCDHCYAFTVHDRRHVAWKRGRMPKAPRQYHLPFSTVQLLPERLDDPLHWRKPRMVFVDSMLDLFYGDSEDLAKFPANAPIPDDYLLQVYDTMRRADWHIYQVLTKRPARMADWLARHVPEPLPNVWHGTSVEDQATADLRIPALLRAPSAVHFISAEPLLGPIDLTPYLPHLDWVIVGAESGPHHRPMELDWARSIRDQCCASGTALFLKQTVDAKGHKQQHPLLDGVLWEQYPVSARATGGGGTP
jgi:protein gp37